MSPEVGNRSESVARSSQIEQEDLGVQLAGQVHGRFVFDRCAIALGQRGLAGTDSPADPDPQGDYAGVVNVSGEGQDGDDLCLFVDPTVQDRDGIPFGQGPTDPTGRTSYWYTVQPVVVGDHDDFRDVSLAHQPAADYTMDDFRIDLDMDGVSPEFFSPQALFGLPGLGLTNSGRNRNFQPCIWAR